MDNFNIEEEVWKDISGFEGYYQVSNLGRVRSLDRKFWSEKRGTFCSNEGRVLKLRESRGYLNITLHKKYKPITRLVHRLVAEAFIPNPKNLEYVNHKDENKSNNRLENLEWCTAKYNSYYGENSRTRPIIGTNILTGEQTTYPSIMEAARSGGFNQSTISSVCKGKRNKHGGHYWQYLEEV